ncbi:MAG TPA: alpha/beta fold hydrolase, partial [Methylobacter sp.]
MTSRILLLTGMTPDARIFKRILPLLPGASIVPWIAPRHHETIRSYARRLAATIDDSADVVVCGVSFGGVIARELALHLDAKACVLVSSVRDPKQLPPWFRCVRHFAGAGIESALASIGQAAALYPRAVRSGSTARLR